MARKLISITVDTAYCQTTYFAGRRLPLPGLGVLGGAISGRGMRHYLSVGNNLDDVGITASKALLTAFDRYGYGAAYDATINLWSSRLGSSLVKSYTQTFVATFGKTALFTPINYTVSGFASWAVAQWGWDW